MTPKSTDLSDDIYRRIYRLAVRGKRVAVIAAGLGLPLRTVQDIVRKLFPSRKTGTLPPHGTPPSPDRAEKTDSGEAGYVDLFVVPRGGYTILDLSGSATRANQESLESQLKRIAPSPSCRGLAVKLTDLADLDETGAEVLMKFAEQALSHGGRAAFLDPPAKVERVLQSVLHDGAMPIFGTESAFRRYLSSPGPADTHQHQPDLS